MSSAGITAVFLQSAHKFRELVGCSDVSLLAGAVSSRYLMYFLKGTNSLEVLAMAIVYFNSTFVVVVVEVVVVIAVASVTKKNIEQQNQKNSFTNGLMCLKGGEINHEVQSLKKVATIYNLKSFFKEEFFVTKKAVYVTL